MDWAVAGNLVRSSGKSSVGSGKTHASSWPSVQISLNKAGLQQGARRVHHDAVSERTPPLGSAPSDLRSAHSNLSDALGLHLEKAERVVLLKLGLN